VRAGAVVVACDAALATFVPRYAANRSRRLHMVATAPTHELGMPALVYARWGYEYHQQLADGRVTLGGYGDLDGDASYTDREESSAPVHARLERHLREELGVEAPVTHRWVGLVGYNDEWRPFAGPVPGHGGLYVLGGYCGTGNVNGWIAGRVVSEQIVDGGSPDADLYDSTRVAA
jgi:glycine/D-amino acid oxidase-like deaminating enzyme